MKSFAFRVVLLVFALSLVAVYVACDRGRQTTNQNQNTANSNENVAMTADKPPDPCEENDLGKKRDKLETFINWKLDRDSNLKDQVTYKNLRFGYHLEEDKPYVFLLIEGAVFGQKKNKAIAEYVEDFIKGDCKIRVVFVRPGTIAGLEGKTAVKRGDLYGFEWCEYPLRACPNGECAEVCPLIVNPSPPVNSNANGNSNMNSRSNSNSNSQAVNANK